MIKAIVAIVLAMPVAFAAETGGPHTLTSVTQFRDVAPGAPYFDSLQSLTERYGVSNGFKGASGVEYRGEKPLSRADMILMVEGALDQVSQLAEMAMMDLPQEKQNKAMKSLSILQGAKCRSMGALHTSVGQIKDVKPTDTWFPAAQSLVEKWSIRIASADGTFGASDTITAADARECLKIFAPGGPSHKPEKLTRGDFAIMLNQALDTFNEDLFAAAAAN
jgi:hypothetical protein